MGGLVLDASVSIAAIVPGGHTADAIGIMRRVARDGAVVPGLWPLEVGHVLLMLERRRLLDRAERKQILDEFAQLPIRVDPETAGHAFGAISTLAEQYGLTVYDASYLELAHRRSVPLASFDVALRRAAEAVGVALG